MSDEGWQRAEEARADRGAALSQWKAERAKRETAEREVARLAAALEAATKRVAQLERVARLAHPILTHLDTFRHITAEFPALDAMEEVMREATPCRHGFEYGPENCGLCDDEAAAIAERGRGTGEAKCTE